MDPNAIALARELGNRPAREREEYYARAGVSASLRKDVEALLDHATTTGDVTSPTSQRTLIGRYEIIRLLGRGGMGHVFLAHDPVLDREVALKLISSEIDDRDARQRLITEARAAGRLRHPNIVTIFDAGEHAGNPYIAMEYLGGETLRDMIRRQAPVPLARRLDLVEGACAGLAHAHRANIVHFDVKPDNLMLDVSGIIKVVDFGIARTLRSDVLVTQHVAGTLRYMSPEQLTGGPLDRRSDVFSLGCSLFELIAYEPAYSGSATEVIGRISAGPVPRLADRLPSVDFRIDALVSRCMAKEPAERFEDLDELAGALRQLRLQFETGLVPSSSAATINRPSSVRSSSRGLVISLGAAALAAVVGAAMWVRAPAPGPNEAARAAIAPAVPSQSTVVERSQTPSPPVEQAEPQVKPISPAATPVPPRAPGSPPPATSALPAAASALREEVWRRLARGDRTGVLELVRGMDPQGPGARLADEVLEAVRTSVQQARENVSSAQRGSPAFSSAEEAFSSGNVLAQNHQPVEALSAIWQAMDLYASASVAPKPLPAPPQNTQNGTQELTSRFPAAPLEAGIPASPPTESQNVLAALGRYHEAISALDLSGVRQMRPTLAPDQIEQLRRSFEAIRTQQVDVRQPRVDVRNNAATVRALVVTRFVPVVGSPQTTQVETEFRLQREAGGWVITAVKVNP